MKEDSMNIELQATRCGEAASQRSAPVLGRSNIGSSSALILLQHSCSPGRCCGRGRPHSDRSAKERKTLQAMAQSRRTPSVAVRLKQLCAIGLCAVLAGCTTTRSISHSGPADTHGYAPRGSSDPGFEYRGELNEFDVLGVDRARVATDEEITRTLEQAGRVELKPGSRVLLVQSGAVFPDGPMLTELQKHFQVIPFSGVPPGKRTASEAEPAEQFSYSKSLRLAAARAGAETVICYWGTLESARRKMETKTVSWVPIAGWAVPDESQYMRIRLKLAIIDVRTGHWRVVCPEPFTDKAWSTTFTRGSSDLKQVEALKKKAYEASVKMMVGVSS